VHFFAVQTTNGFVTKPTGQAKVMQVGGGRVAGTGVTVTVVSKTGVVVVVGGGVTGVVVIVMPGVVVIVVKITLQH